MKSQIKRFAMLTAILMAGAVAGAQEISTSLPMTSVGDRLMWSVGDQDLSLDVPVSGPVKLELYSPRVDPNDYRSEGYYGDETYSKDEAVTTTFTLLNPAGKPMLSHTFTPGAHDWETLFSQNLPAGKYRLQVVTSGNGKNTFALRLAGVSASVSANRISVNVHSRDWLPVLNVSTDGEGYTLNLYDGDGPAELEARLRDSAGNVYPLNVGADKTMKEWPLPAAAGQYVVELRQPEQAKQYSNTVSFALNRKGVQAPLTIGKVDQTGRLRIVAELLLPNGNVPTTVNALVAGQNVEVAGQAEQVVNGGDYPLAVAEIVGAQVAQSTSTVNVPKGGSAEVRVQVKPQVDLSFSTDKTTVCIGDTVTLTARATTGYQGALPLDLQIDAGGLALSGDALSKVQGEFNAAKPGEVVLTGIAKQAGPLTFKAQLAGWGQAKTATINVLPSATTLQLSRSALADAQPGSEVVVRLSVKNTADQAMPFKLADHPVPGLEPRDPTTFEGTLAPGEMRELTYRAKVTAKTAGNLIWQAQLDSAACPAPQQVQGNLAIFVPAPPAPPAPAPAPQVTRQSVITLPFDVPRETRELTVAHSLPAGATYVLGSSRLDGQPVADPKRSQKGTLYWVLPAPTGNGTEDGAAIRGDLTYQVTHTGALAALPKPALSVQLRGNRQELLQGKLDSQDLQGAKVIQQETVKATENPGAIKLPLADSVIRIRDKISVTVEAPVGPIPPLTVNGQPVSEDTIGTNTQDGMRGVQRLTYIGVPIQAGSNVLRFLGQEVTVYKVGSTAKIEVSPVQTLADGSTPIRVKLRTLDAAGKLTDQPTLTINSNLEPRTPDVNPTEPGYQVKLTDGEATLELQPQSAPTILKLAVLDGEKPVTYEFNVTPDNSRVGVGVVSATVGLNSNFSVADNLTWAARGYYEGPLAGGKLYIAADKDRLPTNENTLIRYPIYGDASTEEVPLQGVDPVALTYDHPSFRLQYRQSSLPIDVLPVGEQLTALTAYSKTNPQVSGFVAYVPNDRISNVVMTPQGNRILHLPNGGISLGSETLLLVTLERDSGKEIKRVALTRNVDYVLDADSGVVTLSRALDRVDGNLNEQVVYASYRLDNPLAQRQLAYGAQAKYTGKNFSVGVAAVSLDNRVTYGARALYDNGTTRADGLLAYSGGLQASLTAATKIGDRHSFSVRARYQQPGYVGLAPIGDGLNVSGNYTGKLTPRLSAIVDAEYHDVPIKREAEVEVPDDHKRGGSVTARLDYKLDPFSVGAGARYAFGDEYGLGVVGSVGYHRDPINVDIVHTQPLTGNLNATTDVVSKFKVGKNLNLGFNDKITWGIGQAAALTLDSMIGNVNYAIAYDLPTASGAGNRARFSANTTLPLNKNLALGLRGSLLYDIAKQQPEAGVGADLNYKTDRISATVGGDVNYNQKGFGVVLRGGVTGSVNDYLTLSADGLMEKGQDKDGQRFSLGYAYRNRTLNSLGYVRYVDGTLAGGKPELGTGATAEFRQPYWSVRAGFDTRTLLLDHSSFTWQVYAGGTAYLTDFFGVGAWGRVIGQPATNYMASGYGVEGSLRALPGAWLTAGYNFKGFDGLPSAYTYTKQGAYLRLDLTLDETLGGLNKK